MLIVISGIFFGIKKNRYIIFVAYIGALLGFFITSACITSNESFISKNKTISGNLIITSIPEYNKTTSFYATLTDINGKNVHKKVLVNINTSKKFKVNQLINFKNGQIQAFNSPKNPGVFNFENYCKSKGVFFKLVLSDVSLPKENCGLFPFKRARNFNSFLIKRIDTVMPFKSSASFFKGIFLGNKTTMPEEMTEVFKTMGISHIMAVSGTHVVIITLLVNIFLSILGIKGKLKNFLITLFLIAFSFVTGLEASVIRSSLVAIFVMYSFSKRRDYDALSMLSALASVMLILNPFIIYSSSFILSFSAALGISVMSDKIFKKVQFLPRFFAQTISFDISALISTFPFLIKFFGGTGVFSLLGNLIIMPFIPAFYVLGIILSISASYETALFTDLMFNLIYKLLQKIGSFKYAYINIPENLLIFISFLAISIFTLMLFLEEIKLKKKTVIKIYSVFLIMAVIGNLFFYMPNKNKITAEFLDVGQSECCLLTLNQNKRILIDSGNSYYANTQIVPYLTKKGIDEIDLLVISHYHEDHAGGAEYILNNFNVKKVLSPDTDNELALTVKTICKQKSIPFVFPFDNMSFYIENTFFEVLSTGKADFNNSSLVLKATYGKSSFLFMGDTEFPEETLLKNTDCDVLKVAHHGSPNSTFSSFLEKASPQISVISVGKENLYSFPSDDVLKRIAKTGSKILRTDKAGLIKIEAYKNGVIKR